MARRAAEPVRVPAPSSTASGRSERDVDGTAGRVVGALGQGRRGLEAPPAEFDRDRRASRSGPMPVEQAGRRRTRRAPRRASLDGGPDTRATPARGTDQPRIVHGFDRARGPLARARHLEAAVGGERVVDRVGPAGCSHGACRPDDSISASGACPRWRSDDTTTVGDDRSRRSSRRAASPERSNASVQRLHQHGGQADLEAEARDSRYSSQVMTPTDHRSRPRHPGMKMCQTRRSMSMSTPEQAVGRRLGQIVLDELLEAIADRTQPGVARARLDHARTPAATPRSTAAIVASRLEQHPGGVDRLRCRRRVERSFEFVEPVADEGDEDPSRSPNWLYRVPTATPARSASRRIESPSTPPAAMSSPAACSTSARVRSCRSSQPVPICREHRIDGHPRPMPVTNRPAPSLDSAIDQRCSNPAHDPSRLSDPQLHVSRRRPGRTLRRRRPPGPRSRHARASTPCW